MFFSISLVYTVPDSSPYTFFPLYILPPIRSYPYTFFPRAKKGKISISFNTQNIAMPFFLKAWIPKKTLLRHSGNYSPTRHISMFFSISSVYTVPDSSPYTFFPLYILPPIRSSPYTFFPLAKKAKFQYLLIPPKHCHAPFLKGMDPKRKPF